MSLRWAFGVYAVSVGLTMFLFWNALSVVIKAVLNARISLGCVVSFREILYFLLSRGQCEVSKFLGVPSARQHAFYVTLEM